MEMNIAIRKTRACTVDTLDTGLKSAMRAHGTKFGLEDLESDILMCCETLTIHPGKGLSGGINTTLSAVYVTPKWLVWADSSGSTDVAAGTAQLSQIDVRAPQAVSRYAITPDQGFTVMSLNTDENGTDKMAFIVLEAQGYGQKFRHVLQEALRKVAL